MTDDDDSNSGYSGNQGNHGSRGGGSGGGGNIIMMLLPFLFRYPKIIIPVLVIGGAFFLFRNSCSAGGSKTETPQSSYGTGATLDKNVYDSAEVYAALSPDEQLPERVSLERFAPTSKDQGQQGSCVGWGSTYAARTILESINTGQDPNKIAFSPSYTYNQIGLEGCQGTYINKAMELLTNNGSVPFSEFPYDENSCSKQPDGYVKKEAAQFKMKGANRLSISGDDYTIDVNAIRENLAHNAPVVIGMMVGGSFMQEMEGKGMWKPDGSDYNQNGFGGHCMCVIGYDDKFFEQDGAFLIQNSWGPKWGKNGRAWVSYKDVVNFATEAYGMFPMPDKKDRSKLSCALALIEKKSKANIPLTYKGNNVYSTTGKIAAGTKFKVELKNNIECYIYIFGKETDNGSYILFPYTPKHSAYCGITGTRVFPRDKSMTPDNIGDKDYVCVLVSKEALNFKDLNEKFNSNKNEDYQKRVSEILADKTIEGVKFITSDKITFDADITNRVVVPIIIEINK